MILLKKRKKKIIVYGLIGLMAITSFLSIPNIYADELNNIETLAGYTRYDTSLKVLDKFSNSDTIILVDGKNPKTIINATNLATKYNAPVGLVNKRINSKLVDKIQDLGVNKAIIIGDTDEDKLDIENKIIEKNIEVEKINKEDRELNEYVTEELSGISDKAVVTENLADALSATSYASKNKAPIYLVDKDVDGKTIEKINSKDLSEVIIAGGTISRNADESIVNSKRIEGNTRYDTSKKFQDLTNSSNKIFADGENYVDALISGPLTNLNDFDIALVRKKEDIENNISNILVGNSLLEVKQIENKEDVKVNLKSKKRRLGDIIAEDAHNYLGGRYVWGGNTLGVGVDCSGFTSSLYRKHGIKISRTSFAQRSNGTKIYSQKDAKLGDIVCFPGHVGIYVGNGKMVHASSPKTGIIKTNVNYGKTPLFYVRITDK